ncbi:NAD-dependent epimerase/dehydratase family protein [Saccharophagus degradans]|uniref:NAD-dependent epimerase/dehydratase family protein n=1 Tax=Saccharophagus degradans TaxID=86304 RepID=UPI001C094867|nr:NAD-dependent epimerase/dehydratase family protein [Saccharophagus degradans]MBU2984967.1 NAD-dependent epimerase/dehydratase family protein [Saccharophagus degradans]
MSGKKLLFIGYGDIAGRTSRQFATNGYSITGIARTPRQLPEGVSQWLGSAQDAEILNKISQTAFDTVVITLTPAARSDEGYKAGYVDTLQALSNAWQASNTPPKCVIFVSSTSVYGQNEDEWVDETSTCKPTNYSGQRILEAEKLAISLADNGTTTSCIVRFSGIYGPGRDQLLRQVLAGKAGTEAYTNRIHADDCAGVLAHLIQLHASGQQLASHYLASDCEPVTAKATRQWLAKQLGLPETHLKHDPAAKARAGSKRCNNKRLLKSGYTFIYPSYREGYKDIIATFKQQAQSQQ